MFCVCNNTVNLYLDVFLIMKGSLFIAVKAAFFFYLVCFSVVSLYGGEPALELHKQNMFIEAYGDLPIQGVEVRGLNKTNKSVVLARIQVEQGQPLSSFNPEKTLQRLRKLNLFHSIAVDYEPAGNGVGIIASLKEKMTLIPLPVIRFSGTYQAYGLFLLDMNFLGLGKKLFGGVMYIPPRGWNVQVGYIDPEFLATDFIITSKLVIGEEIFENSFPGRPVFQRFEVFHFHSEFTAGYKIFEKHFLSLLSMYKIGNSSSPENALDVPPSVQAFYQGIRYRYRDIYIKQVLTFGLDIITDYARGIPVKGDVKGHDYSRLLAKYSLPVFSSHRLSLLVHGGAGEMPPAFETRIGGMAGYKTLPSNEISADYYISGTLTYEYPIYHSSFLTVTAAASWEQGAFKKDDQGMQNAFGPGAGFRVYLKKIAIPAVGLDLVYNIDARELLFAASVGAAL